MATATIIVSIISSILILILLGLVIYYVFFNKCPECPIQTCPACPLITCPPRRTCPPCGNKNNDD